MEIPRRVTGMWSNVPPSIFERSSFPMLFKKLELLSAANTVAGLVIPNNGTIDNLYLIGCATANREIRVIKQANQSLVDRICIKNVLAVDIAPQLLEVAEKRMRLLQRFGVVENYSVQNLSAEKYIFKRSDDYNTAVLGIYDLKALMQNNPEKNGEPLGLDEYSGTMRETLGELTQISALQYLDGEFEEKETVIDYDSSASDYGSKRIRQKLRNYHDNNPDICAMRVAIKHKSDPDSPIFVSTWFNLAIIKSIFQELGVECNINILDCHKGAILVINNKEFHKDYGSRHIALALNNVLGNLATDQILTEFTNKISQFCKNQRYE